MRLSFRFDLILIIISLFFDIILLEFAFSNQINKASDLFKLTKLRKIFRLVRAFRSIKIINFFFMGFAIFGQVKELVLKILMCIPHVIKLLMVIIMVQFQFSVIGVEIFHGQNYTGDNPYKKIRCDLTDVTKRFHYFDWTICEYAQLNSIWGQMLLQLQILTGTGWTYMLYEGVESTGSLFWSMLYFILFHLLVQIVLSSLIKGLIWDMFSIVDKEYIDEGEPVTLTEAEQQQQPAPQSQLNADQPQKKSKIKPEDNPIREEDDEEKESIQQDPQSQQSQQSQQPPLSSVGTSSDDSDDGLYHIDISDKQQTDFAAVVEQLRQDPYVDLEKEVANPFLPVITELFIPLSNLYTSHSVEKFLKLQDQEVLKNQEFNYNNHILDMNNQECRSIYKSIVKDFQSKIKLNNPNESQQAEKKPSMRENIMNQKVVMKKAFLKEANIKEIKKQERDIFIHMYGSEYEQLREQNILNSFKKQNECLAYLNTLMKGLFLPPLDFLNLFKEFEANVSTLLGKHTYFKMVFQNKFGIWFLMQMKGEELKLTKFNEETLNSIDKAFPKDGIVLSCNPLKKYNYFYIFLAIALKKMNRPFPM